MDFDFNLLNELLEQLVSVVAGSVMILMINTVILFLIYRKLKLGGKI